VILGNGEVSCIRGKEVIPPHPYVRSVNLVDPVRVLRVGHDKGFDGVERAHEVHHGSHLRRVRPPEDRRMVPPVGASLELNVIRAVPEGVAVGDMGQRPERLGDNEIGENDPGSVRNQITDQLRGLGVKRMIAYEKASEDVGVEIDGSV
jgi:hypothetical protein